MSDAPEFIYARPIGATVDWTGSTSGPWALDDPHNTATEYTRADLSPQWQPIGTAPKKDYGVDVLLRAPDGMVVAWFDTDEQEWISDYRGKGNSQYIHAPTHWMPLPKPRPRA